MTKEELLKILDDNFIDYEVVGEHIGSYHLLVKADEDENEKENEEENNE